MVPSELNKRGKVKRTNRPPEKRDTTKVTSELNKRGKVKRTNRPPKYVSGNKSTLLVRTVYYSIHTHFEIESF